MKKETIKNKERFTHLLDCARKMPEITGNAQNVIDWLVSQNDIKLFLMGMISAEPEPFIVCDSATNTWKGIDYES